MGAPKRIDTLKAGVRREILTGRGPFVLPFMKVLLVKMP